MNHKDGSWIRASEMLPPCQHMVLCYMPLSYNGYKGIHYGWLNAEVNMKGQLVEPVWRAHSPYAYAHRMEDEKHTGSPGSRVTHWKMIVPPSEEEVAAEFEAFKSRIGVK